MRVAEDDVSWRSGPVAGAWRVGEGIVPRKPRNFWHTATCAPRWSTHTCWTAVPARSGLRSTGSSMGRRVVGR